tara:strand:+ start:2020 stop:2613 length:594 start_codon:yes stop_codon:yes gene_type:complete
MNTKIVAVASLIALTACATNNDPNDPRSIGPLDGELHTFTGHIPDVSGAFRPDNIGSTIGTLFGAVAGGLIGWNFVGSGSGQIVASAVGVLAGGIVGREAGSYFNRPVVVQNPQALDSTFENNASKIATTAPVGTVVSWSNPTTGNHGSITPINSGRTQAGDYCRQFKQVRNVGNLTDEAIGVACRLPNGDWEIIDE